MKLLESFHISVVFNSLSIVSTCSMSLNKATWHLRTAKTIDASDLVLEFELTSLPLIKMEDVRVEFLVADKRKEAKVQQLVKDDLAGRAGQPREVQRLKAAISVVVKARVECLRPSLLVSSRA